MCVWCSTFKKNTNLSTYMQISPSNIMQRNKNAIVKIGECCFMQYHWTSLPTISKPLSLTCLVKATNLKSIGAEPDVLKHKQMTQTQRQRLELSHWLRDLPWLINFLQPVRLVTNTHHLVYRKYSQSSFS